MDNNKPLSFRDVYTFPFELKFDTKAMTPKYQMAFDFIPVFLRNVDAMRVGTESKEKIIRIVNGADEPIHNDFNLTYEDGTIKANGLVLILLRGWGHLTGVGGLHLPAEEALRIQNEFGEYILERLTKNQIRMNSDGL